jgi:hypothetical protein
MIAARDLELVGPPYVAVDSRQADADAGVTG